MEFKDPIALGSLLIALVSVITGFILQRDTKKIRELERDNKKYKNRLSKALNAIKGYQQIEEEYAQKEGISVEAYRTAKRKEKQEYFSTDFLTPSRIEEMIQDLKNN